MEKIPDMLKKYYAGHKSPSIKYDYDCTDNHNLYCTISVITGIDNNHNPYKALLSLTDLENPQAKALFKQVIKRIRNEKSGN